MGKTATVTARIDPELKHAIEEIFGEIGLTTSQAITLFFKQVEMHKGLPFPVHIPTETTQEALEDTIHRRHLHTFESPEDLFADLDLE